MPSLLRLICIIVYQAVCNTSSSTLPRSRGRLGRGFGCLPGQPVAPGGEYGGIGRGGGQGDGPDALSAATLGAAAGSALVDAHGDTVRVLVPADTRTARALPRARAARTALVRHGSRTALAELIAADDATAHARALLAPLATSPALTETLRTWLSPHGGWDRTVVALAVHRNTVRQRIGRCAALPE